MDDRIEVLDHGYVRLVESWGSDERIIEAARMSTDKGFQGWGPICPNASADDITHDLRSAPFHPDPDAVNCSRCGVVVPKAGDEKLLAFLWKNNHATPFEMAGAILEVQAPIFVFREWQRHRTQSYNELSARYTPLPDVNYIPTIERLMANASGSNKQANRTDGAEELTEDNARDFQAHLPRAYAELEQTYRWALKHGVPKELARIIIPVGRYSRMRASANLRNWLAFLTLRQAPNAQFEIRAFANAVASLLRPMFPRTMGLFEEGGAA